MGVRSARQKLTDLADRFRAPVRFAFHHFRGTSNIGDTYAGPYHYFEFANAVTPHYRAPIRRCDILVAGGGLHGKWVAQNLSKISARSRHLVIWGSGGFYRRDASRLREVIETATLCGIREYGAATEAEYVPCVSCMHPFFEALPSPTEDVVFYAHAAKSQGLTIPPGTSVADNHGESIDAALASIARGATVVTNSYHGTYWALLMGRRTLCLPFSRKFDFFKMKPGFATYEDWPQKLGAAVAHPEYLEDCREITRRFHDRVLQL